MFFPLPQSMYWQAPIWPQFHVEQFAMHLRGHHQVPVRAAADGDRAHARLHRAVQRGVTIWRLARKG